MKSLIITICVILVLLTVGCSTPKSDSIVGIWKFTKGYDPGYGEWAVPDPEVAFEMEFLEDGTINYKYPNGSSMSSKYTSDTTVIPHRLLTVGSTPNNSKKYAVYKIENNKLIVKSYRDEKLGFPSDVGIEPEGRLYDLLEFQKESNFGEIPSAPGTSKRPRQKIEINTDPPRR